MFQNPKVGHTSHRHVVFAGLAWYSRLELDGITDTVFDKMNNARRAFKVMLISNNNNNNGTTRASSARMLLSPVLRYIMLYYTYVQVKLIKYYYAYTYIILYTCILCTVIRTRRTHMTCIIYSCYQLCVSLTERRTIVSVKKLVEYSSTLAAAVAYGRQLYTHTHTRSTGTRVNCSLTLIFFFFSWFPTNFKIPLAAR